MSVTELLAKNITGITVTDIPNDILHESSRTLINMIAVSLSASHDKPVEALVKWVQEEGAIPRASVIGSNLKTSLSNAALLNGYMAHLHDYDDTHFPTVLHPSAPVWPAILATAEHRKISGREALAAFAIGAEVACRVSMSVHPWHYDDGWHITGTAGVFGAAAGTSWAENLEQNKVIHALGIAGTQASGVREVFGSDTKALHPAKAASNGLQATLLAKDGLTGPQDIIGGRRGFWAVLSSQGHDEQQLIDAFGSRWELRNNGLKPYANGVVSHPIQDAVIQLRNTHQLKPENVTNIFVRVHPLVLELMNRPNPRHGLEGKFSFQHCAASALIDGAGHNAQFSDLNVLDPKVSAMRRKVEAEIDHSFNEDEVYVTIKLTDGKSVNKHIKHASGSPKNPMSDESLENKYRALVTPVLGEDQATKLLEELWALPEAPNLNRIMKLTTKS
ncbi:MAG: MmgE/PrpD family protein [SAR202 cluster bacterium]|nr:MmgE/PrpD family protein [SAR202 cluster bacterium]|tara:strand:+ start:5762 stop:7102 length:1341 start_codon:yes stop_codon:yes gene_type:complete